MRDLARSPSNVALLAGAVAMVAGWALIWAPLGILAFGAMALLLSVALARVDRADGG